MARSNDELVRDLVAEMRDLLSRHVLGQSRQRHSRLKEVIYLIAAYNKGQDIVLAKLAYNPDDIEARAAAKAGLHGWQSILFDQEDFYEWCINRVADRFGPDTWAELESLGRDGE